MEWVSVKDRLPQGNTPVLVYFEDRGTAMVTHFFNDFAVARCGMNGFEEHGVTHWVAIVPPGSRVRAKSI